MRKSRVLVFIVAYQAETTIESVVRRIPAALAEQYEIDVLIIDDSSLDKTFEKSHQLTRHADLPFPIFVLFNPVNQGYGGNQKLGYRYAIENGYDFVALLHGDGQYAPECLPDLLEPLKRSEAAAVMGSRMLTPRGALRGGMPLYKFVGNKILTWLQNRLLHADLSEYHSGYRLYAVSALQSIPFEYNSNGFDFDTQIIIQLMIAKLRIIERPIPTYYGDEICRVNGLRYAADVIASTLRARLQELSLFYDRKYDCAPAPLTQYSPKLTFDSPHSYVVRTIPRNAKVLDLGCAGAYVGSALIARKECYVTGVDAVPVGTEQLNDVYVRDLNQGLEGIPVERHDFVLLLDVIEHLASPEEFLDQLREKLSLNPEAELIISTGNVGFFVTRLMLLLGQFNYGKRGILDLTHTRLFTFMSLTRTLEQAGFVIKETRAVPAPFPLAVGHNAASRFLLGLNSLLNRVAPGLFAYQMIMRAKARPTVKSLLLAAQAESRNRGKILEATAHSGSRWD
jgi:2-polyprenyl-3-methyl-5-hydroxy-6-metoxy-1,4-benzoquinol methylase